MDKRLRSIGKMQYIWYLLLDSRYRDRFWGYFISGNWWHDKIDRFIRKCARLDECPFCKVSIAVEKWSVREFGDFPDSMSHPERCVCILAGYGDCCGIGKKLLRWLEEGCG